MGIKHALAYGLLGFALASLMQFFAQPPIWMLVVTFWAGFMIGLGMTALMFWVDTQIEKLEL